MFSNHIKKSLLLKLPNIYSARTYVCGECLTNRSVIKISGKDTTEFLQGLITNDIEHLNANSSVIYTMFLNVQGRVLFDSFIYKQDSETCLLDCDSQSTDSLINHLKLYKVRRKINFDKYDNSLQVWSVFDNDIDLEKIASDNIKCLYFSPKSESAFAESLKNVPSDVAIHRDPRLVYLGDRLLLPAGVSLGDYSDISIAENGSFDKLRYKFGIAEGAEDLTRGKFLPLEANCDYLHGVSFQKGCYIGQELTARTFHTGVVRKRFMPLFFEKECAIDKNSSITNEKGKSVGKIVGILKNYGIGSLRIDDALNSSNLQIGQISVRTMKPGWWPLEASKDRQNIATS